MSTRSHGDGFLHPLMSWRWISSQESFPWGLSCEARHSQEPLQRFGLTRVVVQSLPRLTGPWHFQFFLELCQDWHVTAIVHALGLTRRILVRLRPSPKLSRTTGAGSCTGSCSGGSCASIFDELRPGLVLLAVNNIPLVLGSLLSFKHVVAILVGSPTPVTCREDCEIQDELCRTYQLAWQQRHTCEVRRGLG